MLGRPAFRLILPDTDADGPLQLPRPAFLYGRVPTDRVEGVHRLLAAGFTIVDVALTFDRPAGRPEDAPAGAEGAEVRDFQPPDEDRVLRIAETCFVYSRFHLDPRIPREVAHRIKREWIRNTIRGRRGERLLVAIRGGTPAGFLAVLASTHRGATSRVIDLIGVDPAFQGQGVGRALVAHFIREYAGKCEWLVVGTQAANIPSVRLYETCGFRLAETAYVLHAHTA